MMARILAKLALVVLLMVIVLPCTAPLSPRASRDLMPANGGARPPSADRSGAIDLVLPHAPAVRAGARLRRPPVTSPAPFNAVPPRPGQGSSARRGSELARPTGFIPGI
jgi:hypothetical protein